MVIGILASGGDGAGMNFCLYNIYKNLYKKHRVVLFNKGYKGLIENDVCNFDYNYLNKHKNDGGIVIKTSRCPQFRTMEGKQKAIETMKSHNMDCLIVLGGNGSLRGAIELNELEQNVMFIPCTIDNDVADSDYCIGFDTACVNCTNFVLHVNETMKSFNRTCIYEAMGRECPQIAKVVAKNVDADYMYVDESCSVEKCLEAIKNSQKDAPIVILRENLIKIEELRKIIEDKLKLDVRQCIVGYVQRGGKPTKKEKEFAKQFAIAVSKFVCAGKFNNAIIYKNGKMICEDIKKLKV